MKYSTLYNMKVQTVSAIDSLFACAKIQGMTFDEILTAYHAILADRPRMPRYMREYMQGRFDLHRDSLYRDSLVYGGFLNGVFYSVKSSRPDYYAKHGIEPADWSDLCHNGIVSAGYHWITTATPKPF